MNVNVVPQELKDRPQWCCWFNGSGRKIPKDAKPNDPTTWVTFDEASTRYQREQSQLAGIGFFFSREDQFCGVDLDGCRYKKWCEHAGEKYMNQTRFGRALNVRGIIDAGKDASSRKIRKGLRLLPDSADSSDTFLR